MLSLEDNDRLTRTNRGTPMGDLVRRFWVPALLSSDLPDPDSEPLRVTLLGERLVAFRDTSGRVGLLARNCAHRCADLFFGRNEENGLRCTYHGWKYDVTGQCVDMPTEDERSTFRDKVRILAYPCREQAGVVWAYLGPEELQPALPEFEWARVPDSQRFTSWNYQESNFAQAIEGGIDSAHSNFLHASLDAYRMTDAWREQGKRTKNLRDIYHAKDTHPQFFSQETDYGALIGSRRETGEGTHYWRFNLFMMPFYTLPPGGSSQKFVHAFVPVDDETCARWTFTYSLDHPLTASEIAAMSKGSGVHAEVVPGTHDPVRNKSNDYLIDRREQRNLTFTGIKGVGEQDFSVQEGMGVIVDRGMEHLGTTDIGIIAMRQRLLKDATNLREGVEPPAARDGGLYRFRAADVVLPTDAVWYDDERVKEALTARW